jgi:hypothetical protein
VLVVILVVVVVVVPVAVVVDVDVSAVVYSALVNETGRGYAKDPDNGVACMLCTTSAVVLLGTSASVYASFHALILFFSLIPRKSTS